MSTMNNINNNNNMNHIKMIKNHKGSEDDAAETNARSNPSTETGWEFTKDTVIRLQNQESFIGCLDSCDQLKKPGAGEIGIHKIPWVFMVFFFLDPKKSGIR